MNRRSAQRALVVHYPDGKVSRTCWRDLAQRAGMSLPELVAVVDGLVVKGYLTPRVDGGYVSALTAGETIAAFMDRGRR